MNKLIILTIIVSALYLSSAATIILADDHADDERMNEHTLLKPAVVKMNHLPAQILLNDKACEGRKPNDQIEDQTSGKMVTCSEVRRKMKRLKSAKNTGN